MSERSVRKEVGEVTLEAWVVDPGGHISSWSLTLPGESQPVTVRGPGAKEALVDLQYAIRRLLAQISDETTT